MCTFLSAYNVIANNNKNMENCKNTLNTIEHFHTKPHNYIVVQIINEN